MSEIAGVQLLRLTPRPDARGTLTEAYRQTWVGFALTQWNMHVTQANGFRGMRVHHRRTDYVVVVDGTVLVGLYDQRPDSSSRAAHSLVELRAEAPCALIIPPGVVHGFYMPGRTFHMLGMTYDNEASDDLLGCRWDDPQLGIAWPCRDPVLVDRDRDAGSLQALSEAYAATRPE
jgi:dTDP-4-dehydrorhamnose 3,5-epimerase